MTPKKRTTVVSTKTTQKSKNTKKTRSIFGFDANFDSLTTVRAMLRVTAPTGLWRGVIAVPPGTLIERILGDFSHGTDIPLELPFFQFFHVVAGFLLKNGVSISVPALGESVLPDIWTILLAASGSGKTYSFNKIRDMDRDAVNAVLFNLTGIKSEAAFFESLKIHNNTLAIRDEWNEFYKAIQNENGPMSGIKDYLLRIYDHDSLEYTTKKEGTQTIDKTALVVLGMTVTDSFCQYLTADDLINGLSQRFSYVICKDDPDRPMDKFPLYKINVQRWKKHWHELIKSIKFSEYIATKTALNGYRTAFKMLSKTELDRSFFRRIIWRAHKYALVYHIICGNGDKQELSAVDYGWAARALYMQICDARELLFQHGLSPCQKTLQKVELLCQRLRDRDEPITTRAIVAGVREIKNVSEAKGFLYMLSEIDDLNANRSSYDDDDDDIDEEELFERTFNPAKYMEK